MRHLGKVVHDGGGGDGLARAWGSLDEGEGPLQHLLHRRHLPGSGTHHMEQQLAEHINQSLTQEGVVG